MKISKLRWLLLLVFLIGAFDEASLLSVEDPNFIWLSLVNLIACALLLTRLHLPLHRTLWAWAILFVFIDGYFLKSFWIARNLNTPGFMDLSWPELAWISTRDIAEAYRWTTLGFVVFCVTSWFILTFQPSFGQPSQHTPDKESIATQRVTVITLVVFGLAMLISILQITLGIGVMGLEVEGLPFRINTIMSRFSTRLAPAILLLCIWMFDDVRPRWRQVLPLTLLGICAMTFSLISTSRGGILVFLLPVFFLWLLTDRLVKYRKFFIVLLLLITVAMFPFLSAMRLAFIEGARDLPEAVSNASLILERQENSGIFATSATAIVTRVSGMEGTLFSLRDMPEGPSFRRAVQLLWTEPITAYYTRDVVGVEQEADMRAPGIVGSFMLLGGFAGVIAFSILYYVLIHRLWIWMSKKQAAPALLAIYSFYIMNYTSEGILAIQEIISLAVVIVICEWLYRNVLTKRRARRPTRQRTRASRRVLDKSPLSGEPANLRESETLSEVEARVESVPAGESAAPAPG